MGCPNVTDPNRGGSIVVDLVERKGFKNVGLFALVRSDEQVKSFDSVAGVTVVRGDLNDGEGIIDIIVTNQSEFILHTHLMVSVESDSP